MFSNCAPENLNEILDEIIDSQSQSLSMHKASRNQCIANLKVLSSWLFQGDALVTVSREGGATSATIVKLVSNPHLSSTLLEQMADYPDAEVRAAVAEHSHLPGHVSYQLSQDESITVRYAVASNATTPVKILEQLREDHNPYVVARATQTMLNIAKEARTQDHQRNIANLNWKENFKAQNISGKNKMLDKQSIARAKGDRGYRSVAAS